MKTSIFTTLNVIFAMFLFTPHVYAQVADAPSTNTIQKAAAAEMVISIIDVQGTRFNDRMWIFSVPECTPYFDNGWDGYKMFGSMYNPQLFAMGEDGNYQVYSVNDLTNSYLGFRAGEDSVYTLTFNHEFIETRYQHLYLVDLVEKKTVDVFAAGSKYTFSAPRTAEPVKRFQLITSLPDAPQVVVVPTPEVPVIVPEVPVVIVPEVPVVIVPEVPVVVVPVVPVDTVVVVPVIVPDPVVVVVVPDTKNKKDKNERKDGKDNKEPKEKVKKVKVYNSNKTIIIENDDIEKGEITLYHAQTGRAVKNLKFKSRGTTSVSVDVPKGIYVAKGSTKNEVITQELIIR
jgi:hypothetical protein